MAAAIALLASCGTAYRPSSLIGPQRIDDHRAVAGPVQVSLRFGAEWVEMTLANIGADPIEVDWNRVVLAESDVAIHHLRELPFIRQAIGVPYGGHSALRTRYALTAQHPLVAPDMPRSEPARIASGEAHTALLYVSEHITVEDGTTIVGQLFCHPLTLHAEQEHVVELIVPVRIGMREDVLRLDAVVAAW